MNFIIFLGTLTFVQFAQTQRLQNYMGNRQPATPSIETLCPNVAGPYADSYRYHAESRKCYQIGPEMKGPCGNNMHFKAKDAAYGYCECNDSDRILVYNAKTKACYYIFQQGYCTSSQWINLNREGKPFCERNHCQPRSACRAPKDLVPFEGSCVQVGTSHKNCGENETVGFRKNTRLPKCVAKRSIGSSGPSLFAIGVPQSPCSAGSYGSLTGLCQPPFDFD